MKSYFKNIKKIKYSAKSLGGLNYLFYDPNKKVMNKKMSDHLKIAICYWHNFCWEGNDAFGEPTRKLPWNSSNLIKESLNKADCIFEFISKLGVSYFTFHDTDVIPYNNNIKNHVDNFLRIIDYFEKKMSETNIKLLWGTANLFSNSRYLSGAATNQNPEIFAYAATQVKYALEATNKLNGDNYVCWGGREGYDTLLNTDLKKEKDHFAKFLSMIVDHKHKIGFKGQLLIEPKPCEPTKHQYDYDTESVYGFLSKYNLNNEFKVNIEANHATLAGHSFEHEIATACSLDFLGSVDANRGDPQNGWDTDQFPNSVEEMSLVIYRLLESGGFSSGGFNFDAKLRRQSIDLEDMFYGHIGGIDVLAKSLLVAEKMIKDKMIKNHINEKYKKWNCSELGIEIMNNNHTLDSLSKYVKSIGEVFPVSGKQEKLENYVNKMIHY